LRRGGGIGLRIAGLRVGERSVCQWVSWSPGFPWGRMASHAAIENRRVGRLPIGPQLTKRSTNERLDSATVLRPQQNVDSGHSLQQHPPPVIISENMLFEADKVMFEIYRETEYTGRYRVVYFTELQDHNKESEINHALAGEHFYDGFIKNYKKDEAKQIIESLLARLNNGERLEPQEVERALGEHVAG